MREGGGSTEELKAWTENLVNTGTSIINHRKKFIAEFNQYILESYKVIMGGEEVPSVTYNYLDDYNGDEITCRFNELLDSRRDEELRRAQNLVGPHKDEFVLNINNYNLRTYGSQGQNKTFQVVLRFAEFFYLKEITGKTPIFLLDDVFGELDANRSAKISSYLKKVGQAFITLTDFSDFSFLEKESSDLIVRLSSGEITYA